MSPVGIVLDEPVSVTSALPALRTQFDGLLDLARSIEARGRGSGGQEPDRGAAAVVVRRSRPRPKPTLPSTTAPHHAARPAPDASVGLGRLALTGLLLLALLFFIAVVTDPIGRFFQDDDATPEIGVVDGAAPDDALVRPRSGGDVAEPASELPCESEEFVAAAESLVGGPVSMQSAVCEGGFAVTRFDVAPADPAGPRSPGWAAFREEEAVWVPMTIGWIAADSDWGTECVRAMVEIDPAFPSDLCG